MARASRRRRFTLWLSPRTSRQWSQTLKLLKADRPGMTGDRMAGELLRYARLKVVRKRGASWVAGILGESAPKDGGKTFTGPPDRPRNVR